MENWKEWKKKRDVCGEGGGGKGGSLVYIHTGNFGLENLKSQSSHGKGTRGEGGGGKMMNIHRILYICWER